MNFKERVKLICDFGNDEISEKVKRLILENIKGVEISFENFSDLKPVISIYRNGEFTGIKFYGNISGGEFQAFLETLNIVGNNEYHISERILDFVEDIDKEVDIKVFVTTSCGWCPPAIKKAVSFAIVSKFINVSIFECYSFPDLAMKYNVSAVPKTVINDKIEFVGVKDDNEFFGYIVKSLGEI